MIKWETKLNKNELVKLSLLGAGSMGLNHLRILSILKNVEVSHVFDLDRERLAFVKEKYGVKVSYNLEDIIDELENIIICTPTSTHFEILSKCIGSKRLKNVFIEKPIAPNYREALELQKIANEKNLTVQCGFIERFNPVVQELKSLLKETHVLNIDFFRTNKLSNRIKDVDVIMDLMIHDIDLALYFNGPVKSLDSYGVKNNGLISFATATLHHNSGAYSRILASRVTERKIRKIEVTASDFFASVELISKKLKLYKQSSIKPSITESNILSSVEEEVLVKNQEALLSELITFINICKEIPADYPNLIDGIKSQEISKQIINNI